MTLGIFINTYNDSLLLERALRDLFRFYHSSYLLWIDDDGSKKEDIDRLERLVSQYNAKLTYSPKKKGQSGIYLLIREMEIYSQIDQMGVDRILKMDPDTTIYSEQAFMGPVEAELYGAQKHVRTDDQDYQEMVRVFRQAGMILPDMTGYCQGGFYMLKPSLLRRIAQSSSWKRYIEIYDALAIQVPEDRMLNLLALSVSASIGFWEKGFFHGSRTLWEYNMHKLARCFPFFSRYFMYVKSRMKINLSR